MQYRNFIKNEENTKKDDFLIYMITVYIFSRSAIAMFPATEIDKMITQLYKKT